MKIPPIIPSAPEILREALVVMVGALIAAALVKSLPPTVQQFFNFTGSNRQ